MKAAIVGLICASMFGMGVGAQDDYCRLTLSLPVKPEPSLTQCYRFNTMACCVSGHDSYIQEVYEDTFSANCLRQYPLLENFFCLGCHPEQFNFVDSNRTDPKIRVCKTYANKLFNLDLHKCGIKMAVQNPYVNNSNPAAEWVVGVHEKSDTKQVVIPQKVFESAEAFLNSLLPPYFENYEIEIVDQGIDGTCFSSTTRVVLGPVLFVVSILLHLW